MQFPKHLTLQVKKLFQKKNSKFNSYILKITFAWKLYMKHKSYFKKLQFASMQIIKNEKLIAFIFFWMLIGSKISLGFVRSFIAWKKLKTDAGKIFHVVGIECWNKFTLAKEFQYVLRFWWIDSAKSLAERSCQYCR